MDSLWIILCASIVSISCSLLGTFLMLRKMSMVGDAISHSVLPGIVIAFLVTQSFNNGYMLLGATTLGIVATLLIEYFHKIGRLQEDASIGVTYIWLFALGVILVSVFANSTDLDQECLLYGEILYIPLEEWILEDGTNLGPIKFWVLLLVFTLVVTFVIGFFRKLFLMSFDSDYGVAIGINIALWHYVFMSMVSFVTVASFEAVGAILVIAFMIIPPATIYLYTDSLKKLLIMSSLLGIVCSSIGYYLAFYLDISVSGMIVVVMGIIFFLSLFFS
ncbi:MAG: metal ABC transporter permease, partial [Saprospiraceae bacterium]|nr:metal ABC transporter permease [Saprospiraceae bacterium]